jgi:signal peptidase I
VASIAVVFVTAGCGGSHHASGSIPVKAISEPTHTQTYTVASSAMEPTLHCVQPAVGCEAATPDRVGVQEPARDVKRGDVLLFEAPPAAKEACGTTGKFIKRVIGLPGEKVEERTGYVYINGERLNEPYVKPDRRDNETGTWHAPQGRYFVMGDNR